MEDVLNRRLKMVAIDRIATMLQLRFQKESAGMDSSCLTRQIMRSQAIRPSWSEVENIKPTSDHLRRLVF
jgi:hypothetical protein